MASSDKCFPLMLSYKILSCHVYTWTLPCSQNFNNKSNNWSVMTKNKHTNQSSGYKWSLSRESNTATSIQVKFSLKNPSDGVTVIWEPQEMPELSGHHLLSNISPKLETGYARSLVGKTPSLKWWPVKQERRALFHLQHYKQEGLTVSGEQDQYFTTEKWQGRTFILCRTLHSPANRFLQNSWNKPSIQNPQL